MWLVMPIELVMRMVMRMAMRMVKASQKSTVATQSQDNLLYRNIALCLLGVADKAEYRRHK